MHLFQLKTLIACTTWWHKIRHGKRICIYISNILHRLLYLKVFISIFKSQFLMFPKRLKSTRKIYREQAILLSTGRYAFSKWRYIYLISCRIHRACVRSFHKWALSTMLRTNLSPLLRFFPGHIKSQLHLQSLCFIIQLVVRLASTGKAREYGAHGGGPEDVRDVWPWQMCKVGTNPQW